MSKYDALDLKIYTFFVHVELIQAEIMKLGDDAFSDFEPHEVMYAIDSAIDVLQKLKKVYNQPAGTE